MTAEFELLASSIHMLTWAIAGGFAGTWMMMFYVASTLNKKIDKLDERLSVKIDKLDEKLTDVDRRLCRIEGAMSNKECCVLKHTHDQLAK
jgi:hypothetical protein